MKVTRTERFLKAWLHLNKEQKILSRKALRLLALDLRHPSLQVKKMRGTRQIWEARASRSIRITFQFGDNEIILRNIGNHEETLKEP
jgi:mRNA interferase RelE/StbE